MNAIEKKRKKNKWFIWFDSQEYEGDADADEGEHNRVQRNWSKSILFLNDQNYENQHKFSWNDFEIFWNLSSNDNSNWKNYVYLKLRAIPPKIM